METVRLSLTDMSNPLILASTRDFFIAYKPPKMHSAPGNGESLTGWCSTFFPEIMDLHRISGSSGSINSVRNKDGGLLHRLDYETQGLVLFARRQDSFDQLLTEQNQGKMIKEYGAFASKVEKLPAGFPCFTGTFPGTLESDFRPYGPGRKEVRPLKEGKQYYTEILEEQQTGSDEVRYLRLRIHRGFRHQIRCHLAWAGFPVLNDPLYGGKKMGTGILALRAQGIEFIDPGCGEKLHYTLLALSLSDLF